MILGYTTSRREPKANLVGGWKCLIELALLCYYVITANDEVLSRTTVQHVTEQELKADETRKQFGAMDAGIEEHLKDETLCQKPQIRSMKRTSRMSSMV